MNDDRPLSLRVGAGAHRGKVRLENQDRISRFRSPFGEVFVVADGMGGHEGGATAAEMLVTGLERHLASLPAGTSPEAALREAATQTNAEIYRRAGSGEPETARMGATSVLALFDGKSARIAHAGDSRAYLLRNGELSRLTRDHTVVQRMLDQSMLSEEEARSHPDASVVTRGFGQKADIDLEIAAPFEVQEGDRILLCSDGLSGYVDDASIQRSLAEVGDAQAATDALIGLALQAGGLDNVSVQLLAFQPSSGSGVTVFPAQPPAEAPAAQAPARGLRTMVIFALLVLAFLAGALIPWRQILGGKKQNDRKPPLLTDPRAPRLGEGKERKPGPASPTAEGFEIVLIAKDPELRTLLAPFGRVVIPRPPVPDLGAAGKVYYRVEGKDQALKILQELNRHLRGGAHAYDMKPWPESLGSRFPEFQVLVVAQEGTQR
jgi:PPM family protein phosphatase